jgi:putative pyruvate formate lyase activating enzyme
MSDVMSDARDQDFVPAYLRLPPGALTDKAERARRHLTDCDLCARYCRMDRTQGIAGAVCRTGTRAVVNSFGPHMGEESCLSGWRGSGTVFFSWCNLRCVYCQNWSISWQGDGREMEATDLAGAMLRLQAMGCHNINLVSPSHVVAQVLDALVIAARDGLSLPLVYNTGGYDSPEALELLDGVVDIYMPDMKYGSSVQARRYSKVRDYAEVNRAAVRQMHAQVGDLAVGADGIARRGLLVRHLVLPGGISGTPEVLRFLASEISTGTFINIMDQYRPCYRADDYPDLRPRISAAEYRDALEMARDLGLKRLDPKAKRSFLFAFRDD